MAVQTTHTALSIYHKLNGPEDENNVVHVAAVKPHGMQNYQALTGAWCVLEAP